MSSIGDTVNRMIKPIGFQLIKAKAESLVAVERDYMRQLDAFKIDLVLDVGACFGQYSKWLMGVGYKNSILSFEPCSSSYTKLQETAQPFPNWQIAPRTALGNKADKVWLNVYSLPGCNSLLEADKIKDYLPSINLQEKEEVDVVRLDSVSHSAIADAKSILLKADVQGFEKYVIEGAENLMHKIQLIHLEVSFVEIYQGETAFLDMANLLNGFGYRLNYMYPEYVDKNGNMIQANAVFARR